MCFILLNRLSPLSSFSSLHDAINPFASHGRLETAVVGNAGGFPQVSGFPAIDEIRLPDEGAAQGNIVGGSVIHQPLGHLEGADAADEHQGSGHSFLVRSGFMQIKNFIVRGF
jgi:hypothetical protein